MRCVWMSLPVFALACPAPGQDPGGGAFRFERDDRENVIMSRIAGAWEMDAPLTARLQGHRQPAGLAFTVDWSVFPDRAFDRLAGQLEARELTLTVYATGLARGLVPEQEVPYFLTALHGTPRIFYFRPRDEDPFGDAESFNVMLAPAEDRDDDLLFRGGDFNNQPFTAYRRKRPVRPPVPATSSFPEGLRLLMAPEDRFARERLLRHYAEFSHGLLRAARDR